MTDEDFTRAENEGRRLARTLNMEGRDLINPYDRCSIKCVGFEMEVSVIQFEADMSSTFTPDGEDA